MYAISANCEELTEWQNIVIIITFSLLLSGVLEIAWRGARAAQVHWPVGRSITAISQMITADGTDLYLSLPSCASSVGIGMYM